MEWQPIETAPLDGETLYLAAEGKVHRGCWVDIPFEERRDMNGVYLDQVDPWCGWGSHDTGEELEPTHWQPDTRPDPPQ